MKKKKGFTLVEIIIVIGIIVIISGVFAVNMVKNLNKNKINEQENNISIIKTAADTFVSMNPERIERLYNGYGYVDIPIGELRDGGVLSEDLKDAITGETIPDDDYVRVKIDTGDIINITYPVSQQEVDTTKAWSLEAQELSIPYDESTSSQDWCSIDKNRKNLFAGLENGDAVYANDSHMYLVDNGNEGKKYTGDYFDINGVNLDVVSCNVNPKIAGTYSITYKFMDPDLKVEKSKSRVVYVKTDNKKDVVKFTAKVEPIEGEEKIVRGWNTRIVIEETYKDGKTTTPPYTIEVSDMDANDKLSAFGYSISDYSTSKVGNVTSIVKRITSNSDGTTPESKKVSFNVISDVYTVSFNANGGTVSPNSKNVFYKNAYGTLPTPSKTGYNFSGWYTASSGGTKVETNTIVNKLSNHTLYARWSPKSYTITFNPNGGSVYPTSKSVQFGSTYGSLPTPSRSGYTFLGWYTASTGGSKISSYTYLTNASNQTIYAHWESTQCTLYYNAMGGSIIGGSFKTVNCGNKIGSLSSASKSGYSFDGWFTSSSGGSQITSNRIMNNDLYGYAQWTYVPSGGGSTGGGSTDEEVHYEYEPVCTNTASCIANGYAGGGFCYNVNPYSTTDPCAIEGKKYGCGCCNDRDYKGNKIYWNDYGKCANYGTCDKNNPAYECTN